MFTIRLYNFNKKPNSTAVPVIAGTQYQCTMKTVSSLLSPVIDIADIKGTGAIPLFNYAYVADFGRYYFIDDVSWSQGIWSLSMHVDVLASFREDIENSRQYVIRSASRSNPYIPDTVYQTYIDTTGSYEVEALANSVQRYNSTTLAWQNVTYFDRPIANGMVCVGVVSGTVSGVTYYAMTVSSFSQFLQKAFTLVPSNMTDLDTGTANAVYGPIQYITYCRWFPVMALSANLGTEVQTINIGADPVTLTAPNSAYQMTALGVEKYRFNIDLPLHPDAVTYPYTRLSPFSEYSLNFQPFGNIPLDTTKMMDASRLTVNWSVDFCTGQCILEVRSNAAHSGLIYTETADYGVPMPISALQLDWKAGLAMSGLTWLKSTPLGQQKTTYTDYSQAYTNPDTGRSYAPAVTLDNTKVIDQMMDVIGAGMGNVVTKGSAGSFLSYNAGKPYIYLWYVKQADHDVARYGSPLCEEVRLDSLSGFCICSNATVSFAIKYPMADEYMSICAYLNSGIYLE